MMLICLGSKHIPTIEYSIPRSACKLCFFLALVWASQYLDINQVRVDKLQLFLKSLLNTYIETELPKVQDEIKESLTIMETELRSIGDA